MFRHYFCLFFLVWMFNCLIICKSEIAENQKNKIEVKYGHMAPNSKFLNPNFDDATNLKFAVAGDDQWNSEKDVITQVSSTVTPRDEINNSRIPRYLKDWSLLSYFRSKINNKNKKF